MIGVQPLLGGRDPSPHRGDLKKLPDLRQWHWTHQQVNPPRRKQGHAFQYSVLRAPCSVLRTGYRELYTLKAFQELKVN